MKVTNKIFNKLINGSYTRANILKEAALILAEATNEFICKQSYCSQRGKLIVALWNAAFYKVAYHSLREYLSSVVAQFSGTPHTVTTSLLKELQSLKIAIDSSPIALSTAFLVHGKPGVGKSYAAKHIGCKQTKGVLKDEDEDDYGELDITALGTQLYLIDEIDKLIDNDPKMLRQILMFLDAKRDERSIIVLTTNEIDKLPPQLMRHGRITRIIKVDAWDEKLAQEFCEYYQLPLCEAPKKDDGFYVGDLIEWARAKKLEEIQKLAK